MYSGHGAAYFEVRLVSDDSLVETIELIKSLYNSLSTFDMKAIIVLKKKKRHIGDKNILNRIKNLSLGDSICR